MSYNFTNKVAVVTGALSGIGLAISKNFLRQGAKVALADISGQDKFEKVLSDLKSEGIETTNAHYVKADATKEADNVNLVKETVSKFGTLDIAVANAGIGSITPTESLSFEDGWRKVLSTNLDGTFLLDQAAIRFWLSNNKPGRIVNMASIHSFVGLPGIASYCAAKGGVKLLTQSLATEYAARGIRINTVNPGYIDTPLLAAMSEEARKQLAALHPIGRLGKPEEIANAVAFLASDEASFIHGTSLLVDGGYTSR